LGLFTDEPWLNITSGFGTQIPNNSFVASPEFALTLEQIVQQALSGAQANGAEISLIDSVLLVGISHRAQSCLGTDTIHIYQTVGSLFDLLAPNVLAQIRVTAPLRVAGVIEEPLGSISLYHHRCLFIVFCSMY
jgi:hypothetical protein